MTEGQAKYIQKLNFNYHPHKESDSINYYVIKEGKVKCHKIYDTNNHLWRVKRDDNGEIVHKKTFGFEDEQYADNLIKTMYECVFKTDDYIKALSEINKGQI